ncbi:MAG: LysM peptidoglycan-binding domain-containing protein [Phycisphaerales bacterium]|nr:LysM peptidoglycan-binding domain-containing protein [Phycisphaerales bacterium]
MEERSSKIYLGLCILVLIWIGVYWAWEPGSSGNPRISTYKPAVNQTDADPVPVEEVVEPVAQELPVVSTLLPDQSPPPRLIPPEFEIHTVVQGEIMQDIAEHYFGKSSMWDVISRANPRIDPLRLRAGMALRIPLDPNNIQGLVLDPNSDDSNTSRTQSAGLVVDYMVQPGDSLSRIAQNYYGSARHADFIYQSNRDTLRSMDAIRVGQTLKLPPLDP